ncbi:MAG: glycosyltransferase family 2 protein [Deltaproteobacteria bacterium]|jgi:glycosyltransferase involved in cell wall biosynthesis
MLPKELQFASADIEKFVAAPLNVRIQNQESFSALPRISVVVPSLNQGRFLERTLLSILNQNYPNTEIIIVDGGSTDETLSVIKKYEKSIAYLISEPDNGQSEALNKGLARATGEIFAWQNSDDIYLPGAFARVGRIFQGHRDVKVCYGNWLSIDENDQITNIHYALKPRKPHAAFENMDAYNQTMFWRVDFCRECGGFDEHLHSLMDTEFIIRTMQRAGTGGFYKINAFLGAFRWHASQKTDFLTMTAKQRHEEKYIEDKFDFPPGTSIAGKFYRVQYRFAQLFQSILYGGPSYTMHKFMQTYRRRGKFI